jgi:hypothetical protein
VIENSPRIVLQTVLDGGGSVEIFSAELKIVSSEKVDAGTYHCQVFNQYGRDEDQISLHVKGSSSQLFLYTFILIHIRISFDIIMCFLAQFSSSFPFPCPTNTQFPHSNHTSNVHFANTLIPSTNDTIIAYVGLF